ncbi:helix-turn-helix domain-containing protein [Vibrio sp. 99-70-13A1]|uniref:helix-turn-helix domain-containing protein n=1 Tax=Vibrio sp. 99-70-13A1 TaxID=2607601 RepID=UPI0014937959|nr:helix-turn-helix domain-containing protein [Vibrio sp. 99-70-13A1]NOH97878.1 helix-turn-helix domain-containing protein [Vibrio sp. 99-70-13A1]
MSASFNAFALNTSPTVFYPLPIQVQGNFLAAKNLYLGEGGGLWIHDVHGKVQFYDGVNLLPRKGSLLPFSSDKIAFHKGEFWTFFDNEVYRHIPGQESALAFSLSPGSVITNIGTSNGYIWVTDDTNFYTYKVHSEGFETYSLLSLYQHNKRSDIQINDAIKVLSKWVLATNSGVYLSDEDEFNHIAPSGKNYIEKLYFSSTRRELVVGTLKGIIIIKVGEGNDPIQQVSGSHVLSLAETSNAYWVGTEHGLFSYDFFSGEVTRFQKSPNEDFALPGGKIYSLINDTYGGMWIATNNGIRYFSLFSKTFSRTPLNGKGMQFSDIVVNKLHVETPTSYWVASSSGVYFIEENSPPKLVYSGNVSDFYFNENKMWLATDLGLVSIDKLTFEPTMLPHNLRHLTIQNIAFSKNKTVWMTSGQNLYALSLGSGRLKNYGAVWLVDKYLPAKITELTASESGDIYIGTDHGFYTFSDESIKFNKPSERFGNIVDIVDAADGAQWFASSYGVYRMPSNGSFLEGVPLVEDNINPRCLISDTNGVWLGSSKGLSYYSFDGQLIRHVGAPFGLVANEIAVGACSSYYDEEQKSMSLLLGSKHGVIKTSSDELLVSNTPQSRVLLSRISIDQETISIGGKKIELKPFAYGTSISFKLGVLPTSFTQSLEYRLNEGEPWTEFEGGLLTLEHLLPGSYTLQVQPLADSHYHFDAINQSFSVAEPWYLTRLAAFASLLLFISIITICVFWRSRFVTYANKQLKAQVALKTDQLRHQSRILLATNQQLKKQLQVKNVLVESVAESLSTQVNEVAHQLPGWEDNPSKTPIINLKNGLEQLKNSPERADSSTFGCDIILVFESVLKAWQGDLLKAGINLDIKVDTPYRHIELLYFNLDILFNSLISSAIKRSYKSQTMKVWIEEENEKLVITIIDNGSPFSKISSGHLESEINHIPDLNIEKLPLLIKQSGGDFGMFTSEAQNKVSLSWDIDFSTLQKVVASTIEQVTTNKNNSSDLEADKLSPEEEWKHKVHHLISEYYSDPEFGTTSAAKSLFMSERSLQRRFKSAYQRTFNEYLNEVRLEKACERLLAGGKISEVAFDSGFNDPSYFSQKFKHHFGVSPSKFSENSD